MEVTLNAFQVLEKVVANSGTSARVYLPKQWVGKKVKILLVESLEK